MLKNNIDDIIDKDCVEIAEEDEEKIEDYNENENNQTIIKQYTRK